MSRSGQLFTHLKSSAFTLFVPVEIKDDIVSLSYPQKEALIAADEKIRKKAEDEKELYKTTFENVLAGFIQWGRDNKCASVETEQNLTVLYNQFFMKDYAGKQSPFYFEAVLKNLQRVLLALCHDQISLEKRIETYRELCVDILACGPGLYTKLEEYYFSLCKETSLICWLAEYRTNLIKAYAIRYNKEHKISGGMSVHTVNAFSTFAMEENWNPILTAGKIEDEYLTGIGITSQNRETEKRKFCTYFQEEYEPNAIRRYLESRFAFEEFGFKMGEWNSAEYKPKNNSESEIKKSEARQDDYNKFIEKLKVIIKSLGFSYSLEDLLAFNDDYTQFRSNTTLSNIINQFCDGIFSPGLYFDPVKKGYCDLVPREWLDEKQMQIEKIDPYRWSKVPDKDFPSVLFRLLKVLPTKHVTALLENLPIEKLKEMTKEKKAYAVELSKIDDAEKRELIVGTIVNRLESREAKEEKDAEGMGHYVFFQPGANQLLDKLLLHVVHGEQDEAEKIIKANPKILLESGRVVDYSDRTIEGTAYEIALGAEDVEMAKMIQDYLIKLPSGKEEMIKQQNKQFPPDWKEEQDTREISALLNMTRVIFDAKEDEITVASNLKLIINERCQEALNQFRRALEPKGIIKQGKHFNPALLLIALKLYDYYYKTFGNWKSPKNRLFSIQVIGYIQRLVPACYAQAFCQGLPSIIEENSKLTRSLKFKYKSGTSFFPLGNNPHYRLGYECFAEDHGSVSHYGSVPTSGGLTLKTFEAYVEKNQLKLAELMQQPNPKSIIGISRE